MSSTDNGGSSAPPRDRQPTAVVCRVLFGGFGVTTMQESGQLERIIIGEGPTAGKPISAVRIGEPRPELPFCAIPSIRWRDNGHTFVLETWFNGEWLEVPLVSTLPPPPNK